MPTFSLQLELRPRRFLRRCRPGRADHRTGGRNVLRRCFRLLRRAAVPPERGPVDRDSNVPAYASAMISFPAKSSSRSRAPATPPRRPQERRDPGDPLRHEPKGRRAGARDAAQAAGRHRSGHEQHDAVVTPATATSKAGPPPGGPLTATLAGVSQTPRSSASSNDPLCKAAAQRSRRPLRRPQPRDAHVAGAERPRLPDPALALRADPAPRRVGLDDGRPDPRRRRRHRRRVASGARVQADRWPRPDQQPDEPGRRRHRRDPADPGCGIGGGSIFHGTHVAGTIGARSNDGTGVAGVSWGARIMPVRALDGCAGSGTSFDIMQGIRYAAGLSNDSGTLPSQRAAVINLSFGGRGALRRSSAADLFTEVRAQGVVVVAAAGNDATSAAQTAGSCPNVISVASVGPLRTRRRTRISAHRSTWPRPAATCASTSMATGSQTGSTARMRAVAARTPRPRSSSCRAPRWPRPTSPA